MDLFSETITFEELLHALEGMCGRIVVDYELPPRSVLVRSNIGKGKTTMGKVISYTICISEPSWPTTERELRDENRSQSPILTIQAPKTKAGSDKVDFAVDSNELSFFQGVADAEVLEETDQDKETQRRRVRVAMSGSLIEVLEKFVRYEIESYVSKSEPFGCCDLYVKCSDAKKCLHPSRFRSTVCAYRKHLESGRVFYGKNKNAGA